MLISISMHIHRERERDLVTSIDKQIHLRLEMCRKGIQICLWFVCYRYKNISATQYLYIYTYMNCRVNVMESQGVRHVGSSLSREEPLRRFIGEPTPPSTSRFFDVSAKK